MSGYLLGLVVVTVTTALSVLGMLLVRQRVSLEMYRHSNFRLSAYPASLSVR